MTAEPCRALPPKAAVPKALTRASAVDKTCFCPAATSAELGGTAPVLKAWDAADAYVDATVATATVCEARSGDFLFPADHVSNSHEQSIGPEEGVVTLLRWSSKIA